MITDRFLQLAEIEYRVCDIASEQLGIGRHRLSPSSRIIEDLHCDSLDAVELLITIEEAFRVTLPDNTPNPVYKAVFTRQPFRLCDLAELVYLQQGTGTPERSRWNRLETPRAPSLLPFTQLTGRWQEKARSTQRLLEPLESEGSVPQYRRRSDGMRCLLVPAASVEIGCASPDALTDEQPKHVVDMDTFLIDAEPVSTTAYCRFLNSIGDVDPEMHVDWFMLDPEDDRKAHLLLERVASEWRPLPGTERWPMILVSWHGANAYSLWANGSDWKYYRPERDSQPPSFLPTEAQWEYAARGHRYQTFPWGDGEPSQDRLRFGQHHRSARYRADTLPLTAVNAQLGMSPFGLHHMAGNIWQWCRDWYDETFYQRPEASARNAWNQTQTKVRSERGGSWIGPAELCRSSYRRGRPPAARGRCLGFRCVSRNEEATKTKGTHPGDASIFDRSRDGFAERAPMRDHIRG
jgi:formylglycine-generating enzyme